MSSPLMATRLPGLRSPPQSQYACPRYRAGDAYYQFGDAEVEELDPPVGSPMPPAPMAARISYAPRRVPGASDMTPCGWPGMIPYGNHCDLGCVCRFPMGARSRSP